MRVLLSGGLVLSLGCTTSGPGETAAGSTARGRGSADRQQSARPRAPRRNGSWFLLELHVLPSSFDCGVTDAGTACAGCVTRSQCPAFAPCCTSANACEVNLFGCQ